MDVTDLNSLSFNYMSFELELLRRAVDRIGGALNSLQNTSWTNKLLPFSTTFFGAYFAYALQKSRAEKIDKISKSDALNKVLQTHIINLQILLTYTKAYFSEVGFKIDNFLEFLERAPFYPDDIDEEFVLQYQLKVSDILGESDNFGGYFRRWEIPHLADNDLKEISFVTNYEPDCIRFSYLASMWCKSFTKELEHRQKILSEYRSVLRSEIVQPTQQMLEALTEVLTCRRVAFDHAINAMIMMHAANLLILKYHRANFPRTRKKAWKRLAKKFFIFFSTKKDKPKFRKKYRKLFAKKVHRLGALRYSASIFSGELPGPELAKNYLMPSYYYLVKNWKFPQDDSSTSK